MLKERQGIERYTTALNIEVYVTLVIFDLYCIGYLITAIPSLTITFTIW